MTSDIKVALSDVNLPAYARQPEIASVSGDHQIVIDDQHRWATPPDEALAAQLSHALEVELGGVVALRPFPQGYRPDVQVRVSFDRFLRGPNSEAEFRGQYLIVGRERTDIQHTARFQITAEGRTASYDSYFAAVDEAIRALARQIANDLRPAID